MSMSASSFMLVLAIMLVTILAIYVTLFSVGTGFDKADRWMSFGDKKKMDETVPPAKTAETASRPEPHDIRHAA